MPVIAEIRRSIQTGARQVGRYLVEPPPAGLIAPSPTFDRFCVIFLAVDWIGFGSLHFAMHADTLNMIPQWLPFRDAAVVVTGIAEVTTGVLVNYVRLRRTAALVSLFLLILLLPAVVHILSDPTALPWPADAWQAQAWRLFGVPHNVFLAICSIHLLRKPYPDPWDPDRAGTADDRTDASGQSGATLLVAVTLLLCNAAGFLAIFLSVTTSFGTAAMWMMMCLAGGGLVGFLFAVPRTNEKAKNTELLVPNRNIEAMSDWLTKIIVGLGLINFREIGAALSDRATILGSLFNVSQSFALAMIIYFIVAGFLEGYLLTRIFIQRHFADMVREQQFLSRQKASPTLGHGGQD
jgi:uncharacterized membrane protein